MEKMMLAIGRFKEGEGKFEKFMAFFQSDEGMAMRKAAATGSMNVRPGEMSPTSIPALHHTGTAIIIPA